MRKPSLKWEKNLEAMTKSNRKKNSLVHGQAYHLSSSCSRSTIDLGRAVPALGPVSRKIIFVTNTEIC